MTVGHLGEVIHGVLAIYLNDLGPGLEASTLGVDGINLGDGTRSQGHRDNTVLVLKDECDITQRAKRHMPISITAEEVEEILVEGILVLVCSGIDVTLDVAEGFIQIDGGEFELGGRRICEICLGRVKLKVQFQLFECIHSVIFLEWDVDETVVRRLSRNGYQTRCLDDRQNNSTGAGDGFEVRKKKKKKRGGEANTSTVGQFLRNFTTAIIGRAV